MYIRLVRFVSYDIVIVVMYFGNFCLIVIGIMYLF